MPVALTNALERPQPPQPPRKLWTRAEITALEATGLWTGQHLELIEGELINKTGKKRPHVLALMRVAQWLVETFGWDRVNTEAPCNVAPEDNPANEPEPDALVLREGASDLPSTPGQEDLLLVVEVADTTLHFDLTVKAELYARAAIPEYWVLDLNGRRLIAHREPEGGRYRSITAFDDNESMHPLTAPRRNLLVHDLLPPWGVG